MKQFYFLATLFLGLLLPSCDKDENNIDNSMPHIVFNIIATDSDGNIIVQQENGEDIIKNLLSVEYHDYTATVKKAGEPSIDRGIDGSIISMSPYIYYINDKPVSIRFGFFSPALNYKDETFTLIWSDGTRDVVKFSTFVSHKKHIYEYSATVNGIPLTWDDEFTPVIQKTISTSSK